MNHDLLCFFAGFVGSFHCIGMCGGFACALGHDPRGGPATALRHVLYNVGRVTTYGFMGALAGALGQALCTTEGMAVPLLDGPAAAGQRVLAVVAGLLMVAMALQLFGLWRGFRRAGIGFTGGAFAGALRSLLAAHGCAAPLALGVLNGFLPCPLVYAFAAQAASTAGVLPGLRTMAAFGLGTFPAMLMMGGIGRLLSPSLRQRGVWLAGSCILVLGIVTLGRGVLPAALHAGHAWHAMKLP